MDDAYKQQIHAAEEYLLSTNLPENFDYGSNTNIIVIQHKSFENTVIAMMKNGIPDADKMSVFRFFTTIVYFEKQKSKKS